MINTTNLSAKPRTIDLIERCVDWFDSRFPDGRALYAAIDAAAATRVTQSTQTLLPPGRPAAGARCRPAR